MIDRPGRGLLRRGAGGGGRRGGWGGGGGGGGAGGGGGGGGRGGGRAGHRRFSFSGPWRPVPAEGRRARKSRSHTYGWGHGVMLLQTAAVCPNSAPPTSTTRRQRPLPGAAKGCIFIFAMAAAH